MIIEKRFFWEGINGDDDPKLLSDKSFLNLMNARVSISEKGRNLRIENCLGTELIPNNVRPAFGSYFCVGSTPDIERNRILFFLQNTLGYNSIYCYELDTSTMYLVLQSIDVTGGITISRVDRNAKVASGLLIWTDNNGEIHKINIDAAIKANDPSYTTDETPYTLPISQSVMTLIKRPFGLAVSAAKINDGTFNGNFIFSFAGEFASRMYYRDGERTVFSTPSNFINYSIPAQVNSFNAIRLQFPTTEQFDQDVQIVQLAVRFNNNPNYFVIREWNKDNATDTAAIAAHNAGSALTYVFYNNQSGNAVGEKESVKPFDNVWPYTKTIELAKDRLFQANYTRGYDTPPSTSLAVTAFTNSTDPVAFSTMFKCNSLYQVGIRFRDYNKRETGVVTNSNLLINIPDRTYLFPDFISRLDWTLSNAAATTEIPESAYYYDILITKCLRTRNFVQDIGRRMYYVFKDSNGQFSYNVNPTGDNLYGVAIKIDHLNTRGLGYSFSEGDYCRIYTASTTAELAVLGQDSNFVILQFHDFGSVIFQFTYYYEIYTPYKKLLDEPFYTIGNSYLITNPTTGSRQYSTLSGSIVGDTSRVKETVFGITARWEAMSPNDLYWKGWFGIYGEPNIETLLGQTEKKIFVSWSDTYGFGQGANGLNSVDYTNEVSVPVELSEINKLQLTNKLDEQGQGTVMLAICPSETASMYLSETQLVAASKQGDVALSADVVGSINVLKGSSGTINPESVIEYLGLVFWIDTLNGFFTQYSSNGLEFVNRYKMSRFFKNYCKGYLATNSNNLDNINGFHHIPTGIDPFHKETLATLPALIYENYANTLPSYTSVPSYATSIIDRFDIYDQLGKTMAFKFEENYWGSNYEWMPEWYEYIQDRLFAWKDGNMYEMNVDDTNYNKFFGTNYPVRACFTGNLNASMLKDLAGISIEGNAAPDFTVALTSQPFQQITDLSGVAITDKPNGDYTNQQSVYYAPFFGDRLDPNQSGTPDQKLYTGSNLTDFAIQVMCEWQQYSQLFFVNFINLNYNISRGQRQIINTINK